MNYLFDPELILKRLKRMDDSRRLSFGIFLLERALPNYFSFQVEEGVLGGGELRGALAQCWSALETGFRRVLSFVTVSACEAFLPDTEDHKSIYTPAALDAVNVACLLLTYIEDRNVAHLVEAVTSRYETLYLFVPENDDLTSTNHDFEANLKHPLMQQELAFIDHDLDFLEKLSNRDFDDISSAVLERLNKLNYRSLTPIGLVGCIQ